MFNSVANLTIQETNFKPIYHLHFASNIELLKALATFENNPSARIHDICFSLRDNGLRFYEIICNGIVFRLYEAPLTALQKEVQERNFDFSYDTIESANASFNLKVSYTRRNKKMTSRTYRIPGKLSDYSDSMTYGTSSFYLTRHKEWFTSGTISRFFNPEYEVKSKTFYDHIHIFCAD